MEAEKLTNRVLSRLSKISDRKFQKRFGEFLIEGVRLVEECLDSSWDILEIVFSDGSEKNKRVRSILDEARSKHIAVWRANARELEKICRTENNQGIAAGVKFPQKNSAEILSGFLRSNGLVIALDAVQDPGNVGTIIRSAEAFRATGVILGRGTAGLFNPKIIRATMGSLFRLPVAESYDFDLPGTIEEFKKNKFQIIGADNIEKAVDFDGIHYGKKVLLIIGQEGTGISEDVLRLCSQIVKIPISKNTESLNAAIACGIFLYHISNYLTDIKKS